MVSISTFRALSAPLLITLALACNTCAQDAAMEPATAKSAEELPAGHCSKPTDKGPATCSGALLMSPGAGKGILYPGPTKKSLYPFQVSNPGFCHPMNPVYDMGDKSQTGPWILYPDFENYEIRLWQDKGCKIAANATVENEVDGKGGKEYPWPWSADKEAKFEKESKESPEDYPQDFTEDAWYTVIPKENKPGQLGSPTPELGANIDYAAMGIPPPKPDGEQGSSGDGNKPPGPSIFGEGQPVGANPPPPQGDPGGMPPPPGGTPGGTGGPPPGTTETVTEEVKETVEEKSDSAGSSGPATGDDKTPEGSSGDNNGSGEGGGDIVVIPDGGDGDKDTVILPGGGAITTGNAIDPAILQGGPEFKGLLDNVAEAAATPQSVGNGDDSFKSDDGNDETRSDLTGATIGGDVVITKQK